MTLNEIKSTLNSQIEPIVVQFTKAFENMCLDFVPDPFMKARLIEITKDKFCEDANTYKLVFNINGFEEFNKSVATSDYYDENNNPILTWFETSGYPKNGICDFYYDDDGTDIKIFNIINENFKVLLTYRILNNGEEKFVWFDSEQEMKEFYNRVINDIIGAKSYTVFEKHKIEL